MRWWVFQGGCFRPRGPGIQPARKAHPYKVSASVARRALRRASESRDQTSKMNWRDDASSSKMAFGVATDVAQQDDLEARWKTFRRRLRDRIRELCEDGHVVRGCYIFPERRQGLRHVLRRVHVLLADEEPIEFYLAVRTRRKINA